MKTKILLAILCLGTLLQAQTNTDYNFEELQERVVENLWKRSDGSAAKWVSSQNKNGSWEDVDYEAPTHVSTTKNHFKRLHDIAQSCTEEGKPHYNDPTYVKALKRGLAYWSEYEPADHNWWYNEIYYPQKLGEVLLMMRYLEDGLPLTASRKKLSEEKLIPVFKPQQKELILSHNPGANATDIALHYLYRALLLEDPTILEGVVEVIEPTIVSNIQNDNTYLDHGPQLQIASYGIVFTAGLVELSYYLSASPAAFDIHSPNYSKFLNYVKQVQIPAIRGNRWDYSCLGRGISRPNSTRAMLSYLDVLAKEIDPDNAPLYEAALLRQKLKEPADYKVENFNRYYWNADYAQHARDQYYVSVRNVSTRTTESEKGNNENITGHYLAYGAMNILIDGSEYQDIMPVWDWRMLPGVTMHYDDEAWADRKQWHNYYGQSSFVGGVSNGQYGNATLTMDKEGVKAQKSTFFFEKEIVCLGAGIEGKHVRTTLNQCNGVESFTYVNEGKTHTQQVGNAVHDLSTVAGVYHNNVAYYFNEPMVAKASLSAQTGSWNDINDSKSDKQLTKDVFKLWIEHGAQSQKASYAYTIVPNIAAVALSDYEMDQLQIIENDTNVQAVYHSGLNILQSVFYTPATLTCNDITLTVDQACTLLYDGSKLTIADPTQTLSSINVTITNSDNVETKQIAMPLDDTKGTSVTLKL